MKDNKSIGVPKSSSSNALKLNGLKVVLIRKNSPEDLILRRLRENLLFSKLRSLTPPQPFQRCELEGATEVKVEPHDIPEEDSDDENGVEPPASGSGAPHGSIMVSEEEENKNDIDNSNGDDVDYEIKVVVEEGSNQFVPSVKIRKMDDSLHISTIALKDVALTSALFRVLEEEKLNIVFENQHRTETQVTHIILVKVKPDYDVEELDKKLCRWAGKPI